MGHLDIMGHDNTLETSTLYPAILCFLHIPYTHTHTCIYSHSSLRTRAKQQCPSS